MWNRRCAHEIKEICQNRKMPSNVKLYRYLLRCYVVIVDKNLPHAMSYRQRKGARWKLPPIKVFSPIFCVIIGPLQCSLQMFYASNFSHTWILTMTFMVFQSTQRKSGYSYSKIFKYFFWNSNRETSIVFNNHDL